MKMQMDDGIEYLQILVSNFIITDISNYLSQGKEGYQTTKRVFLMVL